MRDVMMEIDQALLGDSFIREQVGDTRLKFYEYPPTGDFTGPYIVIDPLTPPLPAEYGDDVYIAEDHLYQLDVWTKNRLLTKEIAKRVQDVMRSTGFVAYGGALDEYDPETKIFRDARRYRAKVYETFM